MTVIALLVAIFLTGQMTPAGHATAPHGPTQVEVRPCAPLAPGAPRVGCIVVGRVDLGSQLRAPAYWYIDEFPSTSAAIAARGPHGVVFDSHGAAWLFTIAGGGWHAGAGRRVARIGALPLVSAKRYAVEYVEGDFTPGMATRVHRHPGVEAFYTVTGETCVETPAGVQTQSAGGQAIIVRAGVPMKLTAIGSKNRFGFASVLQDASKPFSSVALDWKPRGLCRQVSTPDRSRRSS
ncbi:MAG TPA: hypothetical protein VFO25_08835 [Candidatus Eremiobacteraceae bacterium]|nr:hypothetical protein [Candidatus Eremiobacteraceae bacterium]